MTTRAQAGDQLLNPLVDFVEVDACAGLSWGSTLKPPGRLLPGR